MPLIDCPDCGKEVSDQAPTCPNCGRPLKKEKTKTEEEIYREVKGNQSSNNIGCFGWGAIIVFAFFVIGWLLSPSGDNLDGNSYQPPPEPKHDEGMAWQMTKTFVERQLKSPSTAEFPWSSDVEIEKDGKTYTVDGYVDAQNSFGATLRKDFVAKVRYDGGGTWSLIDLEFE